MKNINNLIAISLKSLLKNKRRNFLTIFGIIIGISSVITIMSIGNGFKIDTLKKLDKSENDKNTALIAYVESNNDNFKTSPFNENDISIVKRIKGVQKVDIKNPKNEEYNIKISVLGKKKDSTLSKSNSSSNLISGKGFNKFDNELQRKVVTIDQETEKKLFSSNGLNKKIFINNQGFTVVGITKNDLVHIHIPNRTFEKYLPDIQSEMPKIKVKIKDDYNKKKVGKKIAATLNSQGSSMSYGKYEYSDPKATAEIFGKVLDGITYFIVAVASISLFISGVGVMNVMYISVSERTEEIAIRRAFGARAKDIEIQFLIESIVLCTIGGIIGLLWGVLLSQILTLLVSVIKSVTTFNSALICIVVSMFIGVLFGWIPAKSAASKELIKIIK
ncbi:TPA: ABC transporter permease [Staphylococcus aureus]|nr:ABC transporter permease [Staphylococcus aureus]